MPTLHIEKLAIGADGIARDNDGITCFVAKSLPGECVDATITERKKSYKRATIKEIITKSPHRILPPCPAYTNNCGGCQLLHLHPEYQLDYKVQPALEMIKHALKKSNRTTTQFAINQHPSPACIPSRRRCTLHLQNHQLGFFARQSHEIVPLTNCQQLVPTLQNAIQKLALAIANQPIKMGKSALNLICASDEQNTHLCCRQKLPPKTRKILQQSAAFDVYHFEKKSDKNILTFEYNIENIKISSFTSPDAFFQANAYINTKILNQVAQITRHIKPQNTLDLYAGSGNLTFAAALHTQRQITACDYCPTAELNFLKAWKINQRHFPKNLTPHYETCNLYTKNKSQISNFSHDTPDLLIVDPPRRGLSPQLIHWLLHTPIPHLLYLSCDIATLTRDIQLISPYYQLKSVDFYDMFPNTAALETLCYLRHNPLL